MGNKDIHNLWFKLINLTKKIILWTLSAFFGVIALAFLVTDGFAAAIFGILFILLIVPIEKWQRRIRKLFRRKAKAFIAAILAFACIFSTPLPPVPDASSDNPSVLELESIPFESEVASIEPTVVGLTDASSDYTEPSAAIPQATEVPSEAPTEIPTDPNVPVSPKNSTFSIHFIDVGQADAALVECDGHYMLIDGGNKADSSKIYSILKKTAVPKLDIVVATHAHEDHLGGIPGAYNYTSADLTLCPVEDYDSDAFRDFKKYADKNGGGITIPKVGDVYGLGSATVEILGVNGGSDTNNSSIILRIVYGETSFLFTGDAEREAEQTALATAADLSATVLKVGHHGSDSSTTYPFLRAVMPAYAVISVGEGNTYGHPTENALSRLRDADVAVMRTDMQGDIYCTSDGKTVTMTVSKNPDADVLSGPIIVESPTEKPTEVKPEVNTSDDGRDYVANKNTKKFHYPSCSSSGKIKASNRWDFHGTRQDLIGKGYQPCKICSP